MKPHSREGSLDIDVLTKHGLTADRVKSDPLFFLHMLLPIMPPSDSGIEDYHRMPYFSNAAIWSNTYASSKGLGIGIGHDLNQISIEEVVGWAGCPSGMVLWKAVLECCSIVGRMVTKEPAKRLRMVCLVPDF